ncbi:MAG: TlpA family protein disulfide reductase, partial [Burkholderiales bacterium]
MRKTRNLIVAAVAAGAVAVGGFALWNAKPAAPQVTFVSLKGEKITTAGLLGKVVLVTFWATYCVICIRE